MPAVTETIEARKLKYQEAIDAITEFRVKLQAAREESGRGGKKKGRRVFPLKAAWREWVHEQWDEVLVKLDELPRIPDVALAVWKYKRRMNNILRIVDGGMLQRATDFLVHYDIHCKRIVTNLIALLQLKKKRVA